MWPPQISDGDTHALFSGAYIKKQKDQLIPWSATRMREPVCLSACVFSREI